MNYRRYGKFNFFDYISAWFAIVFMLVLVAIGYLIDAPYYLLIIPLLFSMIMLWSILSPNRERFLISGEVILKIHGKYKRAIQIPNNPILVLSHADISSSFAKQISHGNQSYLLKGRYTVSILQNMPLETVLDALHQNNAKKYTTTTVELTFREGQFVYSFVCNQELLEQLVANLACRIIIPETLLQYVDIDLHQNVFLDYGY